MTWMDEELGEPVSRYFKTPTDAEDLLNRREMIERSTRLGSSVVLLIKEIGTDALFALDLVSDHLDKNAGGQYNARVQAFHRECKQRDLSLAVAQTDVKGDRSLLPSQQAHPRLLRPHCRGAERWNRGTRGQGPYDMRPVCR